MSRTWVLYHANCYDGFGAAWAAWRKLGNEATYVSMQYGDVPSFDGRVMPDGDAVYLVDFSMPAADLELYVKSGSDVTVLDHHASAAEALLPLIAAIAYSPEYLRGSIIRFDMAKSGAVLAWEHFHPGEPVPLMLQYIQDRDLWKFELPDSRAVAAYMRSEPFDFATWDYLHEHFQRGLEKSGIRQNGLAILRFQSQQVSIMADAAVTRIIGGHRVPVVNATLFFSEVGEELCARNPDAPFAAYYLDRADGRRQWGMRSRGGFDCSTVAKKYGGGGHPGAAGFTTALGWLGDD
jgi:oligoribonuclease NrnB/cAMP/cGMP phosphodiesterase (DHH superfamily)